MYSVLVKALFTYNVITEGGGHLIQFQKLEHWYLLEDTGSSSNLVL